MMYELIAICVGCILSEPICLYSITFLINRKDYYICVK